MTRVLALALAAALAVPSLAAAATPKAPSGKYKVVFHGTGSLRVKDKKLTSFSVIPKDDDTACGTTKIKLKVVHTLTTVTRAGYTNWIVGKATPKKADAYQPIKTTLLIDGKTVKGKIKILWRDDNIKSGDGELAFGGCGLDFAFQK